MASSAASSLVAVLALVGVGEEKELLALLALAVGQSSLGYHSLWFKGIIFPLYQRLAWVFASG